MSVSYRLGFDGFGHIVDAPSNRGVRDWLAALEWVRENIAAFGGDATRVTIAGQSAGGGAVLTLLGMPAAQGLFHAVWSLSGALRDISAERARTLSATLARLAGVPPTRAGFASVDEAKLFALQEPAASSDSKNPLAPIQSMLTDGLPWGPTVDGDLIVVPTLESLRAGVGADVPLVLGATDDEFTMVLNGVKNKVRFIPAGLALGRLSPDASVRRAWLADNVEQRRKGTAAVLGRYVSDVVFRSGVPRVAEARAAGATAAASANAARAANAMGAGAAVGAGALGAGTVGAGTWAYRFSWSSPTIGWACHCLDVPFWFDCLESDTAALTGNAPPRALAAALHGSAVAFIRDSAPGWPSWGSTDVTRVFGGPASRPDVWADGYASVRALV